MNYELIKIRTFKILKVICFVVLFFYLFIHISYVFKDDLAYTREHMAGFYAEEKNSIDVVILGTSSTFSAYMPMELWGDHGITAYDLTTNVQLEESFPYYIREMKKYQKPRLLVIDTATFLYRYMADPDTITEDYDIVLRYNTDGLKYSRNRVDLINKIVSEDELYYYFDLLYYHDSYHPKLSYWNNSKHSVYKGYSNLYPNCSYSWENEALDITEKSGYSREELEAIVLDEKSQQNWDKLMEELDNYDGEVLFVIGPVFRKDEDWAKRIVAVRNAINSAGYPLLDMSTDDEKSQLGIVPDEDYSLDFIHYNSISARKITKRLGEYINNNYELTDHRLEIDKKIYSQWEDDYESWVGALSNEDNSTRKLREEFNNK